jgi:hypothetical protein
MKIFISYRRGDSRIICERIHDRLLPHFGQDAIFKDVDSIQPATDFRRKLHEALSNCNALLAIIGGGWLGIADETSLGRLTDENDFVRLEIETALKRGIAIIPVLVNDARMPKPSELPTSIQEFAFRQGVAVRADPDFHKDIDRLIRIITDEVVNELTEQSESTARNDLLGTLKEHELFKHFSERIDRDSLDVNTLIRRGLVSYTQAALSGEGFRQATEDFRKAIGIDNILADPHFGLGTIYYDLAIFDVVKRGRYAIHNKGKMRVNKKTGLPEMIYPDIELSLDNQSRAVFSAALDEFEHGLRFAQLYGSYKGNIVTEIGPDAVLNRVSSIRTLLGYQPASNIDNEFIKIFTVFFARYDKDSFSGLFEIISDDLNISFRSHWSRIVPIIIMLGLIMLCYLVFQLWWRHWIIIIPLFALTLLFIGNVFLQTIGLLVPVICPKCRQTAISWRGRSIYCPRCKGNQHGNERLSDVS